MTIWASIIDAARSCKSRIDLGGEVHAIVYAVRKVLTFLSDFGTSDAYVAQVKARILSSDPDVLLVDITHDVASYAILSGAWLLFTTYACFPKGTVHLAVVDPGVGSQRAVIIVKKAGHIFIGPDNGIFSFLYPADEITTVTWRPDGVISPTFHARDIFAPVALNVLENPSCEGLGSLLNDPVTFEVTKPMVVHIDKFGNVVTNIDCSVLKQRATLVCGEKSIGLVAGTFLDIPEGGIALVCGSSNTIEIAANRGKAAQMTGAYVGMPLQLDFSDSHA
jgi:S-adenosylmethionine hydrolase